MKTLDISGFGDLGAEVVDINLATASDDDLMELGKLVFNELVVKVSAECASVTAVFRHSKRHESNA